MQVCEVSKAVMSLHKIVQAGNRVVFEKEGSLIEDKVTGERMELREEGGMYMIKLWVQRTKGFQRRD